MAATFRLLHAAGTYGQFFDGLQTGRPLPAMPSAPRRGAGSQHHRSIRSGSADTDQMMRSDGLTVTLLCRWICSPT
jgi:hypothetical protein